MTSWVTISYILVLFWQWSILFPGSFHPPHRPRSLACRVVLLGWILWYPVSLAYAAILLSGLKMLSRGKNAPKSTLNQICCHSYSYSVLRHCNYLSIMLTAPPKRSNGFEVPHYRELTYGKLGFNLEPPKKLPKIPIFFGVLVSHVKGINF